MEKFLALRWSSVQKLKRFNRRQFQPMASSSTSKIKVAFGGIAPG
jgi:hypothetical protein